MTIMGKFQPAVDRDLFIGAMRHVAAGVTVVTTDGLAGRLGATVSAFSSLSADPPSVLICLRKESRIAQAVSGNGCYCVNVLPEDKAEVAARFAGAHDAQVADRFDGIDLAAEATVCPALEGATAFHCTAGNIVEHGSHIIVIGQVTGLSQGGRAPLAYLDGRFHCLFPS